MSNRFASPRLAAGLCVLLSFAVNAEPPAEVHDDGTSGRVRNFVLTANALDAFWGELSLEARGTLGAARKFQWVAGVSAGLNAGTSTSFAQLQVSPATQATSNGTAASADGFVTGEIGFNGFLLGRAPGGLWLGPRLSLEYQHDSLRYDEQDSVGDHDQGNSRTVSLTPGASLLLGYTHVFDSGLTLELACGPSVSRVTSLGMDPDNGLILSRSESLSFSVRSWVGVGWAF